LGPIVRDHRARRPALGNPLPHSGERVRPTVDGKPGIAVLLTYGPDRDWLKNLTAAGGGKMRRNGRTFVITDPEVVTRDEAAPYVKRGPRPIFSRLPFQQAVLFTRNS
jgi:hypothetical protein